LNYPFPDGDDCSHSVGVDLVEVGRIANALQRWGERFVHRVYTPAEAALCRGRVPELAARFAGKEAISKALGTGLVGVDWPEMEILSDPRGKPIVRLHARARARAEALGLTRWAISLTHTKEHAIAMVVASQGTDLTPPAPFPLGKGETRRDAARLVPFSSPFLEEGGRG
jgi:holo-[acyl-carrier protein] synthase